MTTAQLHAMTNPASPEQEGEYHRWYDEVHIPQVLNRIDGVVSARRFALSTSQVVPAESLPTQRFLAVYDLDADDPQAVLDHIITALGDGTLDMSDALDSSAAPVMVVWDQRA